MIEAAEPITELTLETPAGLVGITAPLGLEPTPDAGGDVVRVGEMVKAAAKEQRGTTFAGRLVEQTRVGPHEAVVPTISGRAWITGFAQYVVDPDDPFPEGFTVGDIWGGATTDKEER
jgi:proline racemase